MMRISNVRIKLNTTHVQQQVQISSNLAPNSLDREWVTQLTQSLQSSNGAQSVIRGSHLSTLKITKIMGPILHK